MMTIIVGKMEKRSPWSVHDDRNRWKNGKAVTMERL
jgi:hypothetical protein